MVGLLRSGSLGRWFEELCRIKVDALEKVVVSSRIRLSTKELPKEGGVYAFWWTGDLEPFQSDWCQRNMKLPGPGGRIVRLRIDDEWLGLDTELPIPLYVGKNAANIARRIGQHLLLGTEGKAIPRGEPTHRSGAPTTTCQLRAGVESLFPREKQPRQFILENVGLSYVVLDGDEHAANRFYLEDLAIGLMRPPLNVDIER